MPPAETDPQPEDSAERLFVEWVREGGRRGDDEIAPLCEAHPEQAAALARMWRAWRELSELMERAGLAVGPSADFVERFGHDLQIRLEEGDATRSDADSAEHRMLTAELKARLARTRYEPKGQIAVGGQGVIFLVEDRNLTRALAMKVLKPREDAPDSEAPASRALGRFLEEAQVTAQLDHPGIPPVHELGVDADGQVFFTMKYVKGSDLRAVMDQLREGADGWTIGRALEVLLKVCDAMSYAHAKGVLHRDLKPANVMVGRYGEVYVMDWGLARVPGGGAEKDVRIRRPDSSASLVVSARRRMAEPGSDSPLMTMDGDVLGTPAYMSPEQAMGHLDELGPPADVYAIGAMLYDMLVGHMPYVPRGAVVNNLAVWQRVQEGPPRSVLDEAPSVPPELAAICTKAMAREAGERYQSAEELADDIRAFLERRVVHAYEAGAWAELKKWVARNKSVSALAVALAVATLTALIGLSAMADVRRERERSEVAQVVFEAVDGPRRVRDAAAALGPVGPAERDRYAAVLALADEAERARGRFTEVADRTGAIGMEPAVSSYLLAQIADDLGQQSDERRWLEGVLRFLTAMESGELLPPDHDDRWRAAAAAIAADPRFGGLQLEPQFGLVPLGPDPVSGFEEFVLLLGGDWEGGGAIPERNPEGRLQITDAAGVVLVLLPGGPARVGSRYEFTVDGGSDRILDSEFPLHTVPLAPYMIGKYELSFAQWERLQPHATESVYRPTELANEDSATKDFYERWADKGYVHDRGLARLHPVDSVDWSTASAALQRVGLRLPTEAQWEFAARGGTQTRWWTGNDPEAAARASNLADLSAEEMDYGWDKSQGTTVDDTWPMSAPVHLVAANPFGLHGIHGNVQEWCMDAYLADNYRDDARVFASDGSGLRLTHTGDTVVYWVIRGGSYHDDADWARSANRYWDEPVQQEPWLGVRVARMLSRP